MGFHAAFAAERFNSGTQKKKKKKRRRSHLLTEDEAECPMFMVVRWCFRFAECFEDTVVSMKSHCF